MTIISSKYKTDSARTFVNDILTNDYYLFVSSTSNTSVINSNKSKISFLEKTLFGKKILDNEVFYMIKNYPWEVDEIYEQYDDESDLSNKRYYAVVYPSNNETGDYRIYKCLFNNYRSKSTSPPNYSAATPDQIYRMPDGYIWKFMYSLSALEFDTYNARGYIPIMNAVEELEESSNTVSVSTSTIDTILVENPEKNRGYETVSGTIKEVIGNNIVLLSTPNSLSSIANYYSRYSLYVRVGVASKVYTVDTYSYNSLTRAATVTIDGGNPNDGILIGSAAYSLVPRIEILGDGSNCVAVPNVSSDGVINTVTVLNKGSGYNSAIANIPDPYAFDPSTLNSLDERVILRPILSPKGGHGTNLIDELSSRHVLIFSNFTETDNNTIPISNGFASVGIVKNPDFKVYPVPDLFDNRIELSLDEHSLEVNERVLQIETDINSPFYNKTIFLGNVHSISNNVIYISEYMGSFPNNTTPFANTDISDISLNFNLPLISSKNQILNINTDNDPSYPVEYGPGYPGFSVSPYVQRSGEVYYMSRFFPIQRTSESREQFKIILEF